MPERWDPDAADVLRLPSGRLIRGRGLRHPQPAGADPQFGVYLLGRRPAPTPWPARWVQWKDFRLPTDPDDARGAIVEAWTRSVEERVEVACAGGVGRTGTALACLAVVDGVPPAQAVAYVREHYDRRAVETFLQRRFVARFAPLAGRDGEEDKSDPDR
jgi:protein-tyrosine phosphatase